MKSNKTTLKTAALNPGAGARLASRLVRKGPSPMALEQRFMFDGAAATDAVNTLTQHDSDSGLLHFSAGDENTTAALNAAQQQAEAMVAAFLQRPDAAEQMFTLFNGGQTTPSATWQEAANNLITGVQNGTVSVRVELRSNAELQGAKGAFSSRGTTGQATIYLNADWLAGNPSVGIGGADSESINTVLVEELGHYLDEVLNAGADTRGDEGEIFSRFVIDGTNALTMSFLSSQDDHGDLTLDGQSVTAEFASYTFVNAYEMVYDQNNSTNSLGVVAGAIDTTERWADKEQNLHYFDSTHALGQVRINDGSNGVNFSGNDVSATSIIINGNTYYGWISRPIKANGEVKGFYFWTDSRFVDFTTAQADGNQDGDSSVLNNRGFLLVVDQAWFTSQIGGTGTSKSINNTKDGNLGTITVANVGSSSDRVDSALNSLLVTQPAITLASDTNLTAAVELGTDSSADGWKYASGSLSASSSDYTLTATTNATGNVLTNDSSGLNVVAIASNATSQKITTLSSGSFVIQGKYGVLTIDSLGNYSYTPSNSAALVDALLTGTVSETFTYTAANKVGDSATSTLTVSVQASNDAPIAYNDYSTAKESDSTSGTAGYNATGNVLTNDTDVDSGDSKAIFGGSITTSTPTAVSVTAGATQLLFASSNGNSLFNGIVGKEAFYVLGANYYAITDASGNNIYVTNDTTDASGNHVFTFNQNVAKYYDGSTLQTIGDVAAFFKQHPSVYFKDTGTTSYTSSVTYSNGDKIASALSSASSAYTDLTFSGNVSASYAVGMLVTGTNVPDGTNVLSVSYDSVNNVTKVRTTNELTGVSAITTLSFYGKTTMQGSYGTLTLYANGDYAYQSVDSSLTSGQIGTETFTYTMRDTAGVQSRANVVITVYGSGTNDPITSGDTATITEQGVINGGNTSNGASATVSTTTVAGGVLGNDLESSAATSYGNSYVSALRNESNTSSSTISTSSRTGTATSSSVNGTYGSIVMKDDGTYTYSLGNTANIVQTLQSGVAVTDTFYYQVKNTLAGPGISWAKLVVTINGANDIPTATNDTASVTVDGTTTAAGNVLTNDSDVDANDTRAVTQASYSSTTALISSGVLTLTGQYGNLTLNDNGSYTYTLRNSDANVQALTFGQQVHDTFTYTVQDSKSATTTATLDITVTGAEHRPTIGVTGVEVSEGSDAVFQIDVGKYSTSPVLIDLSLANGTATGGTTSPADYDNATYYWSTDSTNWTQVSGNQISLALSSSAATTFYVKVSTRQDNVYEGAESFVLHAAFNDATLKYQNGTSGALRVNSYSDGTANVYDDGSGPDPDGAGALTPDDDRPTLSVAGVSNVSEGSYAAFTVTLNNAVTANTGIKLLLADGTALIASDLNSTTMEVVTSLSTALGSGTNVTNGSSFTLPSGTTTFYVRVLTKQDSSYEGAESFKLTASFTAPELLYADRIGTNTTLRSGASAFDTSTILDDGTGHVYDGVGGNSGTPDNDQGSLNVNSIDVNEGSPYAVFTVTGIAGHSVSLSLSNGSASGGTTSPTDGSVDYKTTLEYYDPTLVNASPVGWTTYTTGPVPLYGTGTLLVRTAIVNDTLYEGSHDYVLTATDAALPSGSNTANGNAVIHDDGTGNIYPNNSTGTTDTTVTKDDDRPLTINNITVNEASPYAVFEVSGAAGQKATLGVTNTTTTGLTTLQYFDGNNWQPYTSGDLVTLDATTGKLLVRVALSPEQEATLDTGETFKLVATNTGGSASTGGTGTIKDDGTGDIFKNDGTTDTTATKDDDRPLTINNITVNEASPYAVFEVSGAAGQKATLDVTNTTTTGLTTLQYFDGTNWQPYTSGDLVTLDATTGKLLVRVALSPEQEAALDTGETFKLVATNTGGSASTGGTGTIKDDGTGDIFKNDGTTDTTATKDDDRPLTINDVTVNEASPYAVFEVSGAAGQKATLGVTNTTTTGLTTLQYFDGTTWQPYTSGDLVTLDASTGKLLVRVALSPEQEATLDTGETFKLVATNTGGTASTGGTGTIKDDGTGDYFAESNSTGTSAVPAGVALDDDRPKPQSPPSAEPAVAPEPAPAAPAAEVPLAPLPPFNSATVMQITSPTPQLTISTFPVEAILTSDSGFPVVVAEPGNTSLPPNLTLANAVSDQFAEPVGITTFALPYDTFAHTKADATVTLTAKLQDGSELPKWVVFNPQSGTFTVNPPANLPENQRELKMMVIARDQEGREAVAPFRFFVGDEKAKGKLAGRMSLTEQLKLATKRPAAPWGDWSRQPVETKVVERKTAPEPVLTHAG